MSTKRVASARAKVRAALLGAAVWAQFSSVSCSRETFDLLPREASAGVGGSGAGHVSGAAGASTNEGGLSNAGGSAGGLGAFGGVSPMGGGSGSFGFGANGGQPPCLAGEPCTDGGLDCPPNVPYCTRCTSEQDCDSGARFCDIESGRCAECRISPQANDCPMGERCDSLTLRYTKSCETLNECDSNHPICDPFRKVCVACTENNHCLALNGQSAPYCVTGYCVECYRSDQCRPNSVCRALRCENR